MPVPDFSPGEVLTAAAMDSIGLWKVTSGTLSSTATNFAGCFSSDYRNYRIIIDQIAFSAAGDLYWQPLNGTTPDTGNHRWALLGFNNAGTTQNSNQSASTTAAYTGITMGGGLDGQMMSTLTMDIMGPFIASRTLAHTSSIANNGGNGFKYGLSMNNAATSYDGIRFLTQSATTVTGNVTIYGYRT
jgi:hypothetical protein